jgi:hypothetical protein
MYQRGKFLLMNVCLVGGVVGNFVCIKCEKNIKKLDFSVLSVVFLCAQCGVPLHPEGCYTQYHTLKHY